MPALCITLAEESLSELERKLQVHAPHVHMLEVRLDYLRRPALPRLPEVSSGRLIATARAQREGGRWCGDETARLKLLRSAAEAGFGWIDLEHEVEPMALPSTVRVLRSFHGFAGLPDLDRTLARLTSFPADCYKIAVQTQSTRALTALLRWRERLGTHCNVLALGMGEMGQVSRILGGFLGNPWTYVAEGESASVAPGQFSLSEALRVYSLDTWVRTPDLYGVIGNPVAHSRSPLLHNALFRHYGLRKLYVPVAVDDLEDWMNFVRETSLPFLGFSVTIPHKLGVRKVAQAWEEETTSFNTLTWDGAGWCAANTDVPGFLRPLEARRSDLSGLSAAVLGTGGVAEAVVPALRSRGMEVIVLGRNAARSRDLAERNACEWGTLSDFAGQAFLCVNTTPVGQYPAVDESPLSPAQLRFQLVYDLVYNPSSTRLLTLAKQAGSAVISGREMFIEQAAGQFLGWTKLDPDRGLMERILEEAGA
jgi:3-dehydroquinate dehydratase / shikimate dehydrogenase